MHGKFSKQFEVNFAFRHPLDDSGTFPDGFDGKDPDLLTTGVTRNCGQNCDAKVKTAYIQWFDHDTQPVTGYGERLTATCSLGESACFLAISKSDLIRYAIEEVVEDL